MALFDQRSAIKAGLTKTEVNISGSLKYLSFTKTVSVNKVDAERCINILNKRAETGLGLRKSDRRVKQILVMIFNCKNWTFYECSF